jgi:hypothetical protein
MEIALSPRLQSVRVYPHPVQIVPHSVQPAFIKQSNIK